MQPTNSEKPTELTMWWPDPSAFHDLHVTDTEDGWDFSAPAGTECADWIVYWSQDEEHHKFFQNEFKKILIKQVEFILEQHGQNQTVGDQQGDYPEQAQEDTAGAVS